MNPYVQISDYERVTGTTVSCEQQSRVQHMLDTNVAMIDMYLGDQADEIWALYTDPLLIDMVCRATVLQTSIPYGVRSEAVGASSVSYLDPQAGLVRADRLVLDHLLGLSSRGNRSVLVNLA